MSDDPAYAYAPRWISTGNWRMSLGLLLMVVGMKMFGAF